MVKRRKMGFIKFARIHHWQEMLENACFRLENSCEHFVNRAKNGFEQEKTWYFLCVVRTANTGNHYVFLRLQTLIFQENACFQPLTPVNTLLCTGKIPMNKRKTSRLQCVNRAVNAGKWFVFSAYTVKAGGVRTLIALHYGRESFASCCGRVNISGGSKIAWINVECNGDSLSVAVPSKEFVVLRDSCYSSTTNSSSGGNWRDSERIETAAFP